MTESKLSYNDIQKMEIFLIFKFKSLYYAARKYWKKHVLKMWMKQNHNTIIPKNTDILYFSLKKPYYNTRKYWKYYVFKTCPSQNQPTMMPKKWRYFLFLCKNDNTMLPENIEKNMYSIRGKSKITLLWCPKNTNHLWLFVKIKLLWCPKIWEKTCTLKGWRMQNYDTMMLTKYR